MRVLHVIGSSTDHFMFDVSFMYGKKCPLDVLKDSKPTSELIKTVQYDYALYVPPSKDFKPCRKNTILWYFIRGLANNVEDLEESTETALANITPEMLINSAADSNFRRKYLPENVEGPLSVGKFLTMLEREQEVEKYSFMVPHFFDYVGLTTIRSLFEDILKIPAPGIYFPFNCEESNFKIDRGRV